MTDKINFILNMTPQEIQQANISYRLKQLISRAAEEGVTQASAFNRLGKGITAEQFNTIVDHLIASTWCTGKSTDRTNKTRVLTINPTFKSIQLPDAFGSE